MIYQMNQNEHTQNQFSDAMKELQIGKLLRKSNISKSCGVSAYEIFQFLLLLVFQGKNLFRFLNSKRKDQAVSKNTYYRFLNEVSFNWKKFILLLAAKVTTAFSSLTRPERVKVLILDDSVITRNRSKAVELLARVYDHVTHKYQKGWTEEVCPANMSGELTGRVQAAAKRVFEVLKLEIYGRVDFMIDRQGHAYCLEANTLPGMTPTSLLPQEAQAVGLSYGELCQRIIDLSLKKYFPS